MVPFPPIVDAMRVSVAALTVQQPLFVLVGLVETALQTTERFAHVFNTVHEVLILALKL